MADHVEREDRDDRDAATAARLELRGLKCPLPALRTARALREAADESVIEVLADDPLSPLDIAHLCRTEGHALLAQEDAPGGGWRFLIRRGAGRA
ncbi:sulfurtransferase TusA family protein [Aureimonas sp. AU4]|uniref:sulfurtransferase TusA family protein n=1 Tax=Aureimonas sp. AU4 TaxID=1638163 RepID=UPI0007061489|nr:sulfurtransferase TusA family protein [Aureimonas sp. AU4]BAT30433.1 sulfurtransferase TusA [Aureimonas sp. AU4]